MQGTAAEQVRGVGLLYVFGTVVVVVQKASAQSRGQVVARQSR